MDKTTLGEQIEYNASILLKVDDVVERLDILNNRLAEIRASVESICDSHGLDSGLSVIILDLLCEYKQETEKLRNVVNGRAIV